VHNGLTEEEEARAALSRTTPDQGGSTYWDYVGLSRNDPRVEADEALGRRAARDQGGSNSFDYDRSSQESSTPTGTVGGTSSRTTA
jgi:hypothetical protein